MLTVELESEYRFDVVKVIVEHSWGGFQCGIKITSAVADGSLG